MKKILITGSAGFIGFHITKKLVDEGFDVVGLDNINSYYDINLKYARLAEAGIYANEEIDHSGGKNRVYKEIEFGETITSITTSNYRFIRLNIEDKKAIDDLFLVEKFDYVIHLAAQAGVRYSIESPGVYIQSNIVGFFNIIEACRNFQIQHLIFASSSSIYGANSKIPFAETDQVDSPVSLYAATKKSNELIAHSYSHLFQLPTTGLRFFTVYGSWGRPDMSPMLFASAITNNKSINVFNNGEMERDFTHINDIVESVFTLVKKRPEITPPYRILNVGFGSPVNLLSFIEIMEEKMGKKAGKNMLPMQAGDVKKTWANTEQLYKIIEKEPKINIDGGVSEFVSWFKSYNLI